MQLHVGGGLECGVCKGKHSSGSISVESVSFLNSFGPDAMLTELFLCLLAGIKGLVKRCRSFKEDIISRLARNKSLGKDEGPGGSGGRRMHTCASEGTSPTPVASDSSPTTASHSPQVTLSHRLKEVRNLCSLARSQSEGR